MTAGHSAPRRAGGGAASARSLLLTVLGEFVLPGGGSAWTGALVTALAQVGVEEKAARQALMRTAAHGLLTGERAGRRTRWRLTGEGARLLTEGTERIYGFGRHDDAWDGRWLVVLVGAPEPERRRRHLLRTRLTWAGLGSPTPGVWLTPDATREKEVADIIDELTIDAFSFTGPFGQVGDQHRIVQQAWSLDEVAARYTRFLDEFTTARPHTGDETFAAQVRLVHEWRGFPFLDPSLPRELLPAQWSGTAAVELFHRRHDEWHEAAQRYWAVVCAAEDSRT